MTVISYRNAQLKMVSSSNNEPCSCPLKRFTVNNTDQELICSSASSHFQSIFFLLNVALDQEMISTGVKPITSDNSKNEQVDKTLK